MHCRREQKLIEREWKDIRENINEIDRAEARKEAREAAKEGDVSILVYVCMLMLCCVFRFHIRKHTVTFEQSRREVAYGMIVKRSTIVGCRRRLL